MSNGKVIYDNSFNSWINKKDLVWLYYIKMSKFFPKSFRSFRRNINVKLDLSNYATKSGIKNISHVDTSSFALKINLAIDKLVPTDLSKLSNVEKKDVVKKTVYDKLVGKVNDIDTSGFVLKTKYNTGRS